MTSPRSRSTTSVPPRSRSPATVGRRANDRVTAPGPAGAGRHRSEGHTGDHLVGHRAEPGAHAGRRAAAHRRVARAGPHPAVVPRRVDGRRRHLLVHHDHPVVGAGAGRRRLHRHGGRGRPGRLLAVHHRRHLHLGGARRAAARRLPASRGPRGPRVVRADAAGGVRRRHDGLGERPDRHVRRPGDPLGGRLRARRDALQAGLVPGGRASSTSCSARSPRRSCSTASP